MLWPTELRFAPPAMMQPMAIKGDGIMSVKSWFDFWCKLGELVTSLKYQALVFSFIGLLGGALSSLEFAVVASIVLGARALTDIKYAQANAECAVSGDTQV
jgi:hypothetical protein